MTVPVNQLYLFFIFLFVYLKIHGLGIVHIAAFVCAIGAAVRYQKIFTTAPYFFVIFALLILQVLYTADFSKDSAQYVVYTMTNIFTMFSALVLLSSIAPKRSGTILMSIMALMILLAMLEVYAGMQPVFNAIRGLYKGDSSVYEAIERDVRQYGQVRPVVFTTEPSSLGNFFGAIWLAYVCIAPLSLRNVGKELLLILLAITIFRSPTLLGYAAVAPGMLLIKSNRDVFGYIYLVTLLLVVAIGFPYLWSQRGYLPPGFLFEFLSSGSFFIRQISPLLTVQYAIESAPILGLGAGFHEASKDISSVLLSLFFPGFYTPEYLTSLPPRKFSSNAFWELIGTFGIVGSIVFVWTLRLALRYLGVLKPSAVLLGTFILMLNHAGIVLTFSWVPMLFLAYSFMDKPSRTGSNI